jgi:hypothetical protein
MPQAARAAAATKRAIGEFHSAKSVIPNAEE